MRYLGYARENGEYLRVRGAVGGDKFYLVALFEVFYAGKRRSFAFRT